MAAPGLSEIITTTMLNRNGFITSNIIENNALLSRLNQRGNIKRKDGGYQLIEEISFAENGSVQDYSGYDILNIAQNETMTSAVFEWKQKAVAVTMSGREELMNSGREQSIDLLESRITVAEQSMENSMSTDIYSNGTGSSGKQIGGLQLLVSDNGTGIVGGIDSSSNAFWQNKVFDFSANSLAASPATITAAMNNLYLQLKLPSDNVDLIVADNTYFNYYLQSLQAIQRITTRDKGGAGFASLDFMGVDVIADGGLGGQAPSAHMYFLNTNHVFMCVHRDRDMVMLSPDRYATNQDAFVRLIGWMGNMTTNSRRQNGVIVA